MSHANLPLFVPHAGCPHACSFCNQRVISGRRRGPTPAEVAALCEEGLRTRAGRLGETEIAFFGGSFTAIDRAYMLSLLQATLPYTGQGGFAGVRVSTRPDAVDSEVLALLRKHRVVAVELGAQSMDDRVLLANGRGHTAADLRRGAALVREAGLQLGLQMMTGLYRSTDALDYQTAKALADLRPDTVRIYPTVVIRGTALEALWRAGAYQPPGPRQAAECCAGLLELFHSRGIPVIRLGLHADELLAGEAVAGAYHPALRELAEGALYRRKLSALLPAGCREAAIAVCRREYSKAVGHQRSNLKYFQSRGVTLHLRGDAALGPYELRLMEGGMAGAAQIAGDTGL